MTKPVMQRDSYQEQSARMTQLGRKAMYNEFKRLAKAIHHDNQTHVGRRTSPRVGTKKTIQGQMD